MILSQGARRHVARDHPADFELCLPHVAGIVAHPLYAGNDLRNPDNFEVVGRVAVLGRPMLVALTLRPDDRGRYRVVSFYRIKEATVDNRRRAGRLAVIPL